MTSHWLLYLLAATGCQAVFALFYWLLLAPLSTFGWNRTYLLSALLLSAALPLLALPTAWAPLVWPSSPVVPTLALPPWQLATYRTAPTEVATQTGVPWLLLALATYWLGVAYQAWRLARSLAWLYLLSRQHPRTRLGRGWLVQLPEPSQPAFSFGKYVFLSPAHAQLSPAEYAQLVQHEQVHGAQHHSLDLLLAEVVGCFFWFNGLVPYLRQQLRTVHEYLADAAVTRAAGSRVAYGRLLLKLAAGPAPTSLVHPFSTRQVALRIRMLTTPPSSPMKKLRFLLVIPVAVLAWIGAAAVSPTPSVAAVGLSTAVPTPSSSAQSRIGTISWQGNKFLSAAQLNEALDLRPGDPYDSTVVEAKLGAWADSRTITSRYMDHGYLFFSIKPVAKPQPNGTTDLLFILNEGPTAQINNITVKGNHKVPTATILQLVPLHHGELFSRAKLLASQRALAESGLFDPTKIGINPQPTPDTGLVNIEYVVVEK
ncbi:M56 family metallopeptidase [Hymenobacter ginkgonis]|nr:M56 family metallopeptidase [Hymenobacter ginkgonis]